MELQQNRALNRQLQEKAGGLDPGRPFSLWHPHSRTDAPHQTNSDNIARTRAVGARAHLRRYA